MLGARELDDDRRVFVAIGPDDEGPAIERATIAEVEVVRTRRMAELRGVAICKDAGGRQRIEAQLDLLKFRRRFDRRTDRMQRGLWRT